MRTKFQQPACAPGRPIVGERAEQRSPGTPHPWPRTQERFVLHTSAPSPSQGPRLCPCSFWASPPLLCSPSCPFPATHLRLLTSSPPSLPARHAQRTLAQVWERPVWRPPPLPPLCCRHWALGPQRTLYPLLFGFGPSHCFDQELEWELTSPCPSQIPAPSPTIGQPGVSTDPTGPSEAGLEEQEAFWKFPTCEHRGEAVVSLWLNVALELPEARFLHVWR